MPLHGNIDQVDRHGLTGWVREEETPDKPVSLLVTVDSQFSTRVLANVYRMDLEQAGLGAGRHGFVIKLDGLSPFEPHTVRLFREADGANIPGSPVSIQPALRFTPEMQDYLATTLADVESVEELRTRAAFLAQQADRLLRLAGDRMVDQPDRPAQRHFRTRWSGRGTSGANGGSPRALIIDDALPAADRDAGSQALVSHMRSLQRLGLAVSFAPADMRGGPGADALSKQNIAPYCGPWVRSVEEVLRDEAGGYALVYFHRVSNARYLPLIRHYQPRARLIYSVADLHYVRLARQAEVEQRPELIEISKRVRTAELSAAALVDAVITHSSFEAALITRDLPQARVHLVPWSIRPHPTTVPFAGRRGVAFIGSYGHPPNLDAAWWLIQDVMPKVRAMNPAIECLLVGSEMPDGLRAAEQPGVRMVGQVADLAAVFNQVRLTVAPLNFGAGVKGKVLDSFAAGVPCACTPIAAEGLDLPEALQAAVAAGDDALAALILRLHEDAAFNEVCSAAGLAYVEAGLSEARLDALMLTVVQPRPPQPTEASPQ